MFDNGWVTMTFSVNHKCESLFPPSPLLHPDAAGISNRLQDVASADRSMEKCQVFLPLRRCETSKDLKTKKKQFPEIPEMFKQPQDTVDYAKVKTTVELYDCQAWKYWLKSTHPCLSDSVAVNWGFSIEKLTVGDSSATELSLVFLLHCSLRCRCGNFWKHRSEATVIQHCFLQQLAYFYREGPEPTWAHM